MPGLEAFEAASDDLLLIRAAIHEAGLIARRYFKEGAKSWKKAGGSPVTQADLAIDQLLHQRLRAARPEFGWLSEETEDDRERLGRKRVWVVDPIDGTWAFIRGKPHFTVSIGLVEDGRPVAGAVYNPALEELFEAEAGRGAWLNGAPIHVSTTDRLEGCRMLGALDVFRHASWQPPWPSMQIESRNSIAYRMVLVAAGQFDAAVSLSHKQDWDLAAADLIVSEAGGCVTTHDGAPLRYNSHSARHRSLICAGPALLPRILERTAALALP